MPTSRRRVVTHRNSSPPVAHCSSTVAASRRITAGDGTDTFVGIRIRALFLVALLAACSGDAAEEEAEPAAPEVPPALDDFLDRVAPHGEVAFTATYAVLQKLGGETVEVRVAVEPPSWRIEVGDVVVTADETCVAGECTAGVQEQQLTQHGFTSRFFSDAPARQLLVDAGRAGAGAPERSEREVAGVGLECIGVPVGAAIPTLACITAEGVFGFVDDPARRVELTAYEPG